MSVPYTICMTLPLHGMHNGKIASILALKQINTSTSREYLNKLKRELGSPYEIYFR